MVPLRFKEDGLTQAGRYNAAYAWCRERFGEGAYFDGACGSWKGGIDAFHFKDENDAFEFKLRWG